jgi:hypothetical protein
VNGGYILGIESSKENLMDNKSLEIAVLGVSKLQKRIKKIKNEKKKINIFENCFLKRHVDGVVK